MTYVSLSGIHHCSDQPVIFADNRSFKYGDGFFETIKVQNGSVQLMKYHFERIISSAAVLKLVISQFTLQSLCFDILELCKKNECIQSARVRISFYRNQKNEAEYLMEAIPYIEIKNNSAYTIDLYTEIKKPIDILSNLKTANYLPYVMASLEAQSKSVNDCLITNTKGSICDSSKANVFIIKDHIIRTPSLTEGCVKGTMRTYLLENCHLQGIEIVEDELTFDQILKADEVFLTNALIGIQPVAICRDKSYSNNLVHQICKKMIQPFDKLIVDE